MSETNSELLITEHVAFNLYHVLGIQGETVSESQDHWRALLNKERREWIRRAELLTGLLSLDGISIRTSNIKTLRQANETLRIPPPRPAYNLEDPDEEEVNVTPPHPSGMTPPPGTMFFGGTGQLDGPDLPAAGE